MAATKSSSAFTWASGSATASGTTNPLDVSADYAQQVYYSIAQVGTAATAASFQVQVQPPGSANWYTVTTVTVGTAAGTYQNTIDVPVTAGKVQIVYAAQAGGTSSTATFELGLVSGI